MTALELTKQEALLAADQELRDLATGEREPLDISEQRITSVLMTYGGPHISLEYNHKTGAAVYLYREGLGSETIRIALDSGQTQDLQATLEGYGVEL